MSLMSVASEAEAEAQDCVVYHSCKNISEVSTASAPAVAVAETPAVELAANIATATISAVWILMSCPLVASVLLSVMT